MAYVSQASVLPTKTSRWRLYARCFEGIPYAFCVMTRDEQIISMFAAHPKFKDELWYRENLYARDGIGRLAGTDNSTVLELERVTMCSLDMLYWSLINPFPNLVIMLFLHKLVFVEERTGEHFFNVNEISDDFEKTFRNVLGLESKKAA